MTMRYTMHMLNQPVRVGIALLIAAFLIAGVMGVPHLGMDMQMDGSMGSDCFMPGMTETLCQMNPLEHIATWQSMFTAVPSQNDALLLLASLFALALVAFLLTHRSIAPPKAPPLQLAFAYYKQHIPIPNPLQEAFSNGILHPKIF